jgi:hypothetical protein
MQFLADNRYEKLHPKEVTPVFSQAETEPAARRLVFRRDLQDRFYPVNLVYPVKKFQQFEKLSAYPTIPHRASICDCQLSFWISPILVECNN